MYSVWNCQISRNKVTPDGLTPLKLYIYIYKIKIIYL